MLLLLLLLLLLECCHLLRMLVLHDLLLGDLRDQRVILAAGEGCEHLLKECVGVLLQLHGQGHRKRR